MFWKKKKARNKNMEENKVFMKECMDFVDDAISKAMPMDVANEEVKTIDEPRYNSEFKGSKFISGNCPVCGTFVNILPCCLNYYCPICGQHLRWVREAEMYTVDEPEGEEYELDEEHDDEDQKGGAE